MAGKAGGMNPDYLSNLQRFLSAARPDLQGTHNLEFNGVFGAVAGYVHGRIFVSCGKFGLALKLPPERCAALIANGSAGPLRYFSKGHIKKSYAVLTEGSMEDSSLLRELMDESIAYVGNSASGAR